VKPTPNFLGRIIIDAVAGKALLVWDPGDSGPDGRFLRLAQKCNRRLSPRDRTRRRTATAAPAELTVAAFVRRRSSWPTIAFGRGTPFDPAITLATNHR